MLRFPAFLMLGLASLSIAAPAQTTVPTAPGRHRVDITSTADGSLQPSYVYVPPRAGSAGKQPLAAQLVAP